VAQPKDMADLFGGFHELVLQAMYACNKETPPETLAIRW